MANPRASNFPLRSSHAPTRELILARRKEYLALCEIERDSAQLEKYFKASLEQQSLMRDGGATMSKAMGNWLVILRTVSLYAEDFAKADEKADNGGEGQSASQSDADKKVLLRVELDRPDHQV